MHGCWIDYPCDYAFIHAVRDLRRVFEQQVVLCLPFCLIQHLALARWPSRYREIARIYVRSLGREHPSSRYSAGAIRSYLTNGRTISSPAATHCGSRWPQEGSTRMPHRSVPPVLRSRQTPRSRRPYGRWAANGRRVAGQQHLGKIAVAL